MKKIFVLLLAAVMVFSLAGILNIASPLKVAAESANLALNKPVTEELEDGTTSMGDPYWGKDTLTDGSRFDNVAYDASAGRSALRLVRRKSRRGSDECQRDH